MTEVDRDWVFNKGGFEMSHRSEPTVVVFPARLLSGGEAQFALSRNLRGPDWLRGYLNGYGGKVKGSETPQVAAIRETEEESGVIVDPQFLFYRGAVLISRMIGDGFLTGILYMYLFTSWKGEFLRTEEKDLPEWHDVDDLPLREMLAQDAHFVPKILECKALGRLVLNGPAVHRYSFRFEPRDVSWPSWTV